MKLNEKILYYRKAAKLSQEELAELVGVSRQAVSKWELGEATPEVDKLLALARAFDVTTDELLSEAEPTPAQKPDQAGTVPPPTGAQSPSAPPLPPSGDSFDKFTGKLGQLIKRYGWLAGVYVALSGLGITIFGALARWGFGAFFAALSNMMSDFGDMGGSWSYSGPPELEAEIMGQLGLGPTPSPFGGFESFFFGLATVILALGLLTMIVGGVLAVILYQKGRKK